MIRLRISLGIDKMTTGIIKYSNIGPAGMYQSSDEYNEYLQRVYIDTGIVTMEHTVVDSATRTTAVTFRSDADKAAFLADPVIANERAARKAFNQEHSIFAEVQSNIY